MSKAEQYFRGQPLTNLPTSIQLYHRCKSMRWAHLPVAGGLYDQHPQLIMEWDILLRMEAEYEKARQDQERAEREAQMQRTR